MPLRPSSHAVSEAPQRLSRCLSPRTCIAACAPFTPSDSGQRSPVPSSPEPEVYNPKAFFPHAASLRQAFAHCGRFPTAASRRSLGRVSVPVWPPTLSGRLRIVALVGRYPTNQLMRRGPTRQRVSPFPQKACALCAYPELAPVSRRCPGLPDRLPTRYSPVRRWPPRGKPRGDPLDLHVLGTPPAFVLSQDQTLREKIHPG